VKNKKEKPIRAEGSLVQYVIDCISTGVEEGRYAPGQRLVVSDLESSLGVSRPPIREALHVLSGEGVIDLIPNRGAIIRTFEAKELIDLLTYIEALGVLGVRQATPKMKSKKNKQKLIMAFDCIKEAYESYGSLKLLRALHAYHIEVNEISENYWVNLSWKGVPFHFFNPLLAQKLPDRPSDRQIFLDHYEQIHAGLMTLDPHVSTTRFMNHMQWVISLINRE
jgi:DNA-binding GntR family transcriptional regulator